MKRMLGLSSLCPRRVCQKLSGAETTMASLGSLSELEISSQHESGTVGKDHSDKAQNRDSACLLRQYGSRSDSDVIVTVTMDLSPGRKVAVAQSAPASGSGDSGHVSECGKLGSEACRDRGSGSGATDFRLSNTFASASAIASSHLNDRNTSSGQRQSYSFSRVFELLVPANTHLLVDVSGQDSPELTYQPAPTIEHACDIRFSPNSNNINLIDIEIQEANGPRIQAEHEFETENHFGSSGPEQGDGDAAAGPLLSDDTNDAYSHWYSDISTADP